MTAIPATIENSTPIQSLFHTDPIDQLLLSVHLLGKPTSAQLYRLLGDHFTNLRSVQKTTERLSKNSDTLLSVIKPIDITNTSRRLPYVFLDTTASRRLVERQFGIPFRRPPELPSRDWRFLRHDVDLVDDKIAVELTARRRKIPFGYQGHFDDEGQHVYPRVTITNGDLVHTLRPQPDETLIVGDYHLILEHDCGQETVDIGNIIRDATVGRKQLVYGQLEQSGTLEALGWGKRIYVYIIDSPKRTKSSARKRVKRCVETFPIAVDPHKFFFVDRYSFMEAGDNIGDVPWVRADGQVMTLPCWR